MHDLVIRGGNVVDGTGAAPITADVAIDGDRVVAVGQVSGTGRREIAAHGALVAPGWVDGGFTHQALRASPEPEALRAKAKLLHPLGRMAMPRDVAHAVTWLLSDQAGFITGSMLLVDGGFMVQHNA